MKPLRIALNVTLIALFALAYAIPAMTSDAPEGGFSANHAQMTTWRASIPKLEVKGDSLPGCHPLKKGELVDTVAVVRLDGHTERMSFDEAWSRAHDGKKATDVWVVGGCVTSAGSGR